MRWTWPKPCLPDGHLAMASDHYYFLGSGRAGEKDPPATRARFLSNRLHGDYERDYAQIGAVLAAQGVPYRIDEMNSCYNGGAKDSSDTYASTLWALDCTHWWAAHHILGMNYHTGESVGTGWRVWRRELCRVRASGGWPWNCHATASLCLSGFQPGRAWTTPRT